jgi:hypothetical protein
MTRNERIDMALMLASSHRRQHNMDRANDRNSHDDIERCECLEAVSFRMAMNLVALESREKP